LTAFLIAIGILFPDIQNPLPVVQKKIDINWLVIVKKLAQENMTHLLVADINGGRNIPEIIFAFIAPVFV
jgi:hypothetical protein